MDTQSGACPYPAFTLFDHTADVGVIAYGQDIATVFAHAGQALFSVMVDLDDVAETVSREVVVDAADREALLVEWLNELLFLVDAERLVFRRFAVVDLTGTHLRALAYGEPIDPARHQFKAAVKAATYHLLGIADGPPYRAQVILDL